MEEKRINVPNNHQHALTKEENKRLLNKLLNDDEFIENNNYLLRLFKKSENLPDKVDLFFRVKNPLNKSIKANENTIEHAKDKIELTYELDDLLYNHSKSFSKSKNKYYKIKKENDEFLAFYKYNKNNKSKTINSNAKSSTPHKKKIDIQKTIEENKNADVFFSDNYLLMKNQSEIYYHFLFQSLNERKNYTQQRPYKYIAKIKRYLRNKTFDKIEEEEDTERKINEHIKKKEYIKTETNFFNLKKKFKSENPPNLKYNFAKMNSHIIKDNNLNINISNYYKKKKNLENLNIKKLNTINTKNDLNITKEKENIKFQGNNSKYSATNSINSDINKNIKNSINKNMNNNNNKNENNIQVNKNINNINNNINNTFNNKSINTISNEKNEINNNFETKNNINNNTDNISINNNSLNINNNKNKNNIKNNNNFSFKSKDSNEIGTIKRANKYLEDSSKEDNISIKDIENKINKDINGINKSYEKEINKSSKSILFNKKVNLLAKYNTNEITFSNKNKIIKNIHENNNKIKLKMRSNKIDNQNNIYNKKITHSNINEYYYLNKSKTIDKKDSINNTNINTLTKNDNKNNKSKDKINIFQINKNYNKYTINPFHKSLIKDKNKKKENKKHSINYLNNNSLNNKKRKTIFGLYEEQKNKLNRKNRQNNLSNFAKKRTYDQLILYSLDLLDKKRGRHKSSFLTDTNNINYSNTSNKKYILNYYKGQSLESLVNTIKMKNSNNKLYKFLRDELFQNNNVKRIENENKYLNNLDKYFIKKYSEFQVLISYADDNS